MIFLPFRWDFSSRINCSNSIPDDERPGQLQINFDEMTVYYWGKMLRYPGNFSASVQWNDSSYLVAADCADSSLYFFCLDDTNYVVRILLPKNISCNSYSGVFFHRSDRFYFLGDNGELYLYDNGDWKFLHNLTPLLKRDKAGIMQVMESGELFVAGDTLVYFRTDRYPYGESSRRKNVMVTAKYQIGKEGLTYTGMDYPEQIYRNYFGLIYNMYQHFYNGKIYYTFKALPEVWEYDEKTVTLKKYPVRSVYQEKEIMPLSGKPGADKDLLFRHSQRSGKYLKLIYDPFQKQYYRFFVLPLQERNEAGLYNTYRDVRISLMVLDLDFRIKAEQLLPADCYFIFYTGVSREGLYINYGPVVNQKKNGVKFLKVTFAEK